MNFGDIEQAIKDRCDHLKRTGKWPWLATAKSYGGEFDEDLLDVVKRFPAIWVTVTGDQVPERIAHNRYKHSVKIVVLVGASSMRNEEARRHGAGTDIGTYAMLEHVWRQFIGSKLGLCIEPLELGRTKTIFNTQVRSQSISVLAQEFSSYFIIQSSDRDREDDNADEMRVIHTDYYYQPTDKTYADPADARDVIELKG